MRQGCCLVIIGVLIITLIVIAETIKITIIEPKLYEYINCVEKERNRDGYSRNCRQYKR